MAFQLWRRNSSVRETNVEYNTHVPINRELLNRLLGLSVCLQLLVQIFEAGSLPFESGSDMEE